MAGRAQRRTAVWKRVQECESARQRTVSDAEEQLRQSQRKTFYEKQRCLWFPFVTANTPNQALVTPVARAPPHGEGMRLAEIQDFPPIFFYRFYLVSNLLTQSKTTFRSPFRQKPSPVTYQSTDSTLILTHSVTHHTQPHCSCVLSEVGNPVTCFLSHLFIFIALFTLHVLVSF